MYTLGKSLMLFGSPVRVKDSILSIPVPRSLQLGGMTSTSTYYFEASCDALFFILPTPNILTYVHIFNHFIKFLSHFVGTRIFSFHAFAGVLRDGFIGA